MCPFGLDQSEAIRQKVLSPLKAHTFKLPPRSNRGDMQEGADDKILLPVASPFFIYDQRIISHVPAVRRAAPMADFSVNSSCRKRTARRRVKTTLSLSTATTAEVSPICSALK